jgi:hypothetical protein
MRVAHVEGPRRPRMQHVQHLSRVLVGQLWATIEVHGMTNIIREDDPSGRRCVPGSRLAIIGGHARHLDGSSVRLDGREPRHVGTLPMLARASGIEPPAFTCPISMGEQHCAYLWSIRCVLGSDHRETGLARCVGGGDVDDGGAAEEEEEEEQRCRHGAGAGVLSRGHEAPGDVVRNGCAGVARQASRRSRNDVRTVHTRPEVRASGMRHDLTSWWADSSSRTSLPLSPREEGPCYARALSTITRSSASRDSLEDHRLTVMESSSANPVPPA